jgi:nitrite transporter NirC
VEHETIAAMAAAARAKAGLLRHGPRQYLVLSALAGAYVGLGIVLIFAIGAPLQAAGSGATRAVMGASFGVALTLVIFAGSELFTGNNLVMTVGALSRTVTPGALARVWALSFGGNLAGSALLALATAASGVLAKAPAKDFVVGIVAAKMSAPLMELFFRGVLCNALVCLAVWMGMRAKDETARLVLIFWCLFAFIGAGFEHSVANMTLLALGLLLPHDPALVSWAGFARNLAVVTIGNIVGGALLIGLPYWYVAQGQRRMLAVRPVEEEAPRAAVAG